MSATGLELSMSSQDVGNAQETIDAKFEGGELTVAFNPVFLRDGVDAIDGSEVALETIDPLKPATLRAAEGGDFLYLLMPVRTS
jgi:DNA polymerase-3 subunit beta